MRLASGLLSLALLSCGGGSGGGQQTQGPGQNSAPGTPAPGGTPDPGGSSPSPTPPPDFLPYLPNTWYATTVHTFNFGGADPSGAFTVQEAVDIGTAAQAFFQGQGTLKGADIHLTVDHGDPTPWRFDGQFVDQGTIQLTATPPGAPASALALKRGLNLQGSVVDDQGRNPVDTVVDPASQLIVVGQVVGNAVQTANVDRNTFSLQNAYPFPYLAALAADLSDGSHLQLSYAGLTRADPTLVYVRATAPNAASGGLAAAYDGTKAGAEFTFSWNTAPAARIVYVVHVRSTDATAPVQGWELVTGATTAGWPSDAVPNPPGQIVPDFASPAPSTGYEWWVDAYQLDSVDAAASSGAPAAFRAAPLARSKTSQLPAAPP